MNKTDSITLLRGDCLEILPTIADCSCDMAAFGDYCSDYELSKDE